MTPFIVLLLLFGVSSCITLASLIIAITYATMTHRLLRVLRDRWDMRVIRLPSGDEYIHINSSCLEDFLEADRQLMALRSYALTAIKFRSVLNVSFRCSAVLALAVIVFAF